MVYFSLHSCFRRFLVADSEGQEVLASSVRRKSFGSGVLSLTKLRLSMTLRILYLRTSGLLILLALGHVSLAFRATRWHTPVGGILPGSVLKGVTVGSAKYI